MGIISSFIKGTQLHTENETGTRRKIKKKTSSNKRPVVLYRLVAQNRYDDIFTHTRTTDTPIVSFQGGGHSAPHQKVLRKKDFPLSWTRCSAGWRESHHLTSSFFYVCLYSFCWVSIRPVQKGLPLWFFSVMMLHRKCVRLCIPLFARLTALAGVSSCAFSLVVQFVNNSIRVCDVRLFTDASLLSFNGNRPKDRHFPLCLKSWFQSFDLNLEMMRCQLFELPTAWSIKTPIKNPQFKWIFKWFWLKTTPPCCKTSAKVVAELNVWNSSPECYTPTITTGRLMCSQLRLTKREQHARRKERNKRKKKKGPSSPGCDGMRIKVWNKTKKKGNTSLE